MNADRWQFWIDVGGTFTDCVAKQPDGALVRHKTLSSGVVKGGMQSGSTSQFVLDSARRGMPNNFWRGYVLKVLGSHGEVQHETTVVEYDAQAGRLVLANPLPKSPVPNAAYELTSGEEAPIVAIRHVLGLSLDADVPPLDMRLGTTRGTNALLTRQGARTAFVTTQGFGDILHIGNQDRPRLFELDIRKHEPLSEATLEIEERISSNGKVLVELDKSSVQRQLSDLQSRGIQSLAICLLNSYTNPQHEEAIERIALEVGFSEISCSYRVAPLTKIVSRGDTTVLDAYLNPVLRTYVSRLRQALGPQSTLTVLTSAGGLVFADQFTGKDSILSGPAGGVVGYSKMSQAAGFEQAIGFDMGGTSTDVSRFDGQYELEYEKQKAGVRIVSPMMAIETVAAGGGSICHFDGTRMQVGPQSAGSDPGPCCYGKGGPLTITDMNFYTGRLLADHFPFPLDSQRVEKKLQRLSQRICRESLHQLTPLDVANGFLRVANENMGKAIRSISLAKGYDPSRYVLAAFGGASAQHACGIARDLGIRQVLDPEDGGILSAVGIGLANVVRHGARGVYRMLCHETLQQIVKYFAQVEPLLREEVKDEAPDARLEIRLSVDIRYQSLDAYLTVPWSDNVDQIRSDYESRHDQLYGFRRSTTDMEVVAARIEVIGHSTNELTHGLTTAAIPAPVPLTESMCSFGGEHQSIPVHLRHKLKTGHVVAGPALVVGTMSTTVIEPGWSGTLLSDRQMLLTDVDKIEMGLEPTSVNGSTLDPFDVEAQESTPVELEIYNNRFASIAEQMGVVLRKTAISVNVKERLDFSCAIFDATGNLVVNAPHIPVHLGAMAETVKWVNSHHRPLMPGDVIVTNDPYQGGSHLPDITVITPVHELSTDQLLFFTASRAHHAEIGGITPGSMPPFSHNLSEEGVLIRSFKVIDQGQPRLDQLANILRGGPYPSRSVDDNLSDVEAQIAANKFGALQLLELAARNGTSEVLGFAQQIQMAAESKMRSAIQCLSDGTHEFRDHLDDGSPICVKITVQKDIATIDFSGTGPVMAGNLNANRAIVWAAIMYCFRCLIDEDIPLNQGVTTPLRLHLPTCLLNPPRENSPESCAAIVGGNVETSQRVVDVILGALGLAAASQGTMNNLLFGDENFGYYETICGGAGATPDFPGADAVHTHMTNTRLTDPEILEQRFPVRVRQFAIRRGSGGSGKHRGGDGVIREIEFLRKLDVSVLSQRRSNYQPYSLAGGTSGKNGNNVLYRANGETDQLPGLAQFMAQPGDRLRIETPGGGGYGPPSTDGHAT